MQKVYFDNSATSLPKAPGVSVAMKDFLDMQGYNVGRGAYAGSLDTALEIMRTRELLADFFGAAHPRKVIFTPGFTQAINMILSGFLDEGDHVITTSLEHNSVMRPLHALSKRGLSYDIAPCDENGVLDPARIVELIKPSTKAVIMSHASNVCGTVLPLDDVGRICKEQGLRFIVDGAQTAGVIDIKVSDSNIDALAFPGHKALLGPQGIGGFVISEDFAEHVDATLWGGTGSLSHGLEQPQFLPDKFESGTMNIPGILGLKAAVEYVQAEGVEAIHKKEMQLYQHFVDAARELEGMRLIAVGNTSSTGTAACNKTSTDNNIHNKLQKVAVISVDFPHHDNAEIATLLDKEYDIMARCGLHCSPSAHKTLGTYPEGTLRFSFGHKNTIEEVDYLVKSLRAILSSKGINCGV